MDITLSLVRKLIAEQFPKWINLPINPVEISGIDNRMFRLGDDMVIRLPSAQCYALQVLKEQKYLPQIASHLSTIIPEPIAMGKPSANYPWNWSIYRWINGNTANIHISDELALELAMFLNELHNVDINDKDLLPAGHNFYRGTHISIYTKETEAAIDALRDFIDAKRVAMIWKNAISSRWDMDPVLVHGDMARGNIIVKNRSLAAIIDFGCMGIGDPACDLVIAWTLLKGESRRVFQEKINLDNDTWLRARGWALWKALITLVELEDRNSIKAMEQYSIIDSL
ncbi:aminoglycoside phosphotransferase family protein [Rickettsiaceae bacterium]|nr:aminoglycoside phosphotransferase family protein [Rickettsiaceae bacterium]